MPRRPGARSDVSWSEEESRRRSRVEGGIGMLLRWSLAPVWSGRLMQSSGSVEDVGNGRGRPGNGLYLEEEPNGAVSAWE